MKARFVFEAIEFERGKDPKDALNVGIKDKIINLGKIIAYDEECLIEITLSKEETKQVLQDMSIGKWTYKDMPDGSSSCSEYMSFVSKDEYDHHQPRKKWFERKKDLEPYLKEFRYLDGELEGKFIKYDGEVYKIPYIPSQRGW